MIISDELEKCDMCGEVVYVDDQYMGVCHKCCEDKDLGSCSSCGELFSYTDLSEHDYRCENCRKIDERRGEV